MSKPQCLKSRLVPYERMRYGRVSAGPPGSCPERLQVRPTRCTHVFRGRVSSRPQGPSSGHLQARSCDTSTESGNNRVISEFRSFQSMSQNGQYRTHVGDIHRCLYSLISLLDSNRPVWLYDSSWLSTPKAACALNIETTRCLDARQS